MSTCLDAFSWCRVNNQLDTCINKYDQVYPIMDSGTVKHYLYIIVYI